MEEEDEESERKEIKEDVSFSDLSDVPKLEAVDLNVSTASEAPKPVTFESITQTHLGYLILGGQAIKNDDQTARISV